MTDAGLEHLKGLTQLHSLDLGGTKVTDAGLEHLKGLAQLESLELRGTKVTDAAAKVLTKLCRTAPSLLASSTEFMGEFWLGKIAECVI